METLILLAILAGGGYWIYNKARDRKIVHQMLHPVRTEEPPARTTLPSPDDTRMAQAQMMVARNIMFKSGNVSGHAALQALEGAGTALRKVTQLDPGATIEVRVDKDDFTTTFTYDHLAAQLLYLESLNLDNIAKAKNAALEQWLEDGGTSKSDSNRMLNEVFSYQERSRDAVKKAVQYMPDHVPYLVELLKKTVYFDNKPEARKLLKRILQLEPYNVEALEMANRLD